MQAFAVFRTIWRPHPRFDAVKRAIFEFCPKNQRIRWRCGLGILQNIHAYLFAAVVWAESGRSTVQFCKNTIAVFGAAKRALFGKGFDWLECSVAVLDIALFGGNLKLVVATG